MEWNSKCYITIAIIASLFVGSSQPVFAGLILARVLTQLTVPMEYYPIFYPGKVLEDEINFYSLIMAIIAVATFLAMFVQKLYFNRLSEEVTYHMRYNLYNAILSKNIGWFDLRENSVGVLSAAMASDTSLVNGVSAEGLGP